MRRTLNALWLAWIAVLLLAAPVLGQRRRRRRRRTRSAKCTTAVAYNVKITKMKKEESKSDFTVEDDDDKAFNCMTKCAEDKSGKWKYFALETPEDKNEDLTCKCIGGKLKKVKDGEFVINTGGIDLASSQLLLKKAKRLADGQKECSTTAPPTPAPTEMPTYSPTGTPTPPPTFSPATLFEVVAGEEVDASSMWGGDVAAPEPNYRNHDQLNNYKDMPFQELRVSVVKDSNEVAYFSFANAGAPPKGFFNGDNLVATSYTDLLGEDTLFFQIDSWDQNEDPPKPGMVYLSWGAGVTSSGWFSEENGGLSQMSDKGEGDNYRPIVGIECKDNWCDNKRLRWPNQMNGAALHIVKSNPPPKSVGFKISEEHTDDGKFKNTAICPQNQLVSRIKCTGDNCDDMEVHCSPIVDDWELDSNMAYTDWNGGEWNGGEAKDCGTDRFVSGIICKDPWCGSIQLVCVKAKRYAPSIGRDFYITKNHGGCDQDAGWLTVDSGAKDNDWDACEWENAKVPEDTKLQIFYAPNNKVANYLNGAQKADKMTITGVQYEGWVMAFKLGSNAEQMDLYQKFTSGGDMNVDDAKAKDPKDPSKHYRSHVLDTFMKLNAAGRVKIEIYKAEKVVKQITFRSNAGDAKEMKWFSVDNVISSSWAGIKKGMTSNFFSVVGDDGAKRRFFIQHNYDGCGVDSGWLVAKGKPNGPCPWENDPADPAPFIYYSPTDNNAKWQDNDKAIANNMADTMVVSVSFETED